MVVRCLETGFDFDVGPFVGLGQPGSTPLRRPGNAPETGLASLGDPGHVRGEVSLLVLERPIVEDRDVEVTFTPHLRRLGGSGSARLAAGQPVLRSGLEGGHILHDRTSTFFL